jgi:hypothetical protein
MAEEEPTNYSNRNEWPRLTSDAEICLGPFVFYSSHSLAIPSAYAPSVSSVSSAGNFRFAAFLFVLFALFAGNLFRSQA